MSRSQREEETGVPLENCFMSHRNLLGEVFYSCDFCGETRSMVATMRIHLREKHSDARPTATSEEN
jgi:hypothetical protein